MGSIAVEHLKPTLLLVMGHQRCGAVAAAVGSKGVASQDNIGHVVAMILPFVERAKQTLIRMRYVPALHSIS